MNRRSFVCVFASGVMAVRVAAAEQQPAQVHRVGFLRERQRPLGDGFFGAMRKLGWIEGRNFKMESRYADSAGQLATFATELVQLKVDLIFTNGTAATLAAKQATATIPIVFSVANDPVQSGIVFSLARPGGNLTGFAYGFYGEKMLDILKAAIPGLVRVAMSTGGGTNIARAAQLLGVQVLDIELRKPDKAGDFFASARKAGAGAALIADDPSLNAHMRSIGAEATKSHMPSIGVQRDFAEEGLLSYGPAQGQHWPRLAAQIDRILRGAKPRDLPVELPERFELVINLKAAKTLGLTLPQSLLLRADEVIQ
jgi:putative ABC transport system substrate-binding protein